MKSAIRLLVRDAADRTRPIVERQLETHRGDVRRALLESFQDEFPKWTTSLAAVLSRFEDWLAIALRDDLAALSIRESGRFLEPLHQVRKQAFRTLQQFRDGLSERTMRAFGVPLRTTETEIELIEPGAPDIRIGRVFDRNWELLSPVLPVSLIRGAVRRHFSRTIPYLLDQNLSRLRHAMGAKHPCRAVERREGSPAATG